MLLRAAMKNVPKIFAIATLAMVASGCVVSHTSKVDHQKNLTASASLLS